MASPIRVTEGCLSLPDVTAAIDRCCKDCLADSRVYEGQSAIVILHEIDHLNGMLITDFPKNMKIIAYPETRQVFNFDCGANALVSVLVFAGIEEREDRMALLAGTTKDGTSTTGVLRVLHYYGLPFRARQRMKISDLRRGDRRRPPDAVDTPSLPRIQPALPGAMGRWPLGRRHRLTTRGESYLKTLPHSIAPGLPTKSYASAGTTWTGANASANGAARSWSKDNSPPATTSTWTRESTMQRAAE